MSVIELAAVVLVAVGLALVAYGLISRRRDIREQRRLARRRHPSAGRSPLVYLGEIEVDAELSAGRQAW